MAAGEAYTLFFERLNGLRILVIGDLMLDRYLWGKVNRISPEAPVPVVDVTQEESRPGGAANVGLNLHALGCQVHLCGVTGQDAAAAELRELLSAQGFDTALILPLSDRRTTSKTRVIARQHLLRVDREDRHPLTATDRARLMELLATTPRCHALVLEDYDKGLLDPALIQAGIAWAQAQSIPVLVDPKYAHFFDYAGCTLFKPNLKELNEALGLRLNGRDTEGIRQAVETLRTRMPHRYTLVTLSEHGMLAVDEHLNATHIPAHYRKITDVSGAGDTVVAVMAAALAAGLDLVSAARLANLAGGIVCEESGVVTVPLDRLRAESHSAT